MQGDHLRREVQVGSGQAEECSANRDVEGSRPMACATDRERTIQRISTDSQ